MSGYLSPLLGIHDDSMSPAQREARHTAGAAPRYRLGVLEGDGIGAEIVPAAVQIADAALAAGSDRPLVEWLPLPVGAAAIAEHGCPTPPHTLETLAQLDGWVLGPHD